MDLKMVIAAALAVLAIVLLTLKLSGSIKWAWWLVLSPLYPIAGYLAWLGACVLLMMWVFKDGM